MNRARRLAVAVTVASLLALPGTAPAQFLPVQEEAAPGITMSGTGLARVAAPNRLTDDGVQRAIDAAQPSAAARAVRDARRRSAAVAAAAGVRLGGVAKVELENEFPQFGQPRRHCRAPRRDEPPRCRVPTFAAAVATVTVSIAGGTQGVEDGVNVEAYGTASAPVVPENRRANGSIRQALATARGAVTPDAAAAARRAVETAARSAGLTLGAIVSISEQRQPYPYFYDPALGSFGPGRFCGVIRRPVVGRDPDTGAPRVLRRVRERRCRFPRTFSLRLEATYEAQ